MHHAPENVNYSAQYHTEDWGNESNVDKNNNGCCTVSVTVLKWTDWSWQQCWWDWKRNWWKLVLGNNVWIMNCMNVTYIDILYQCISFYTTVSNSWSEKNIKDICKLKLCSKLHVLWGFSFLLKDILFSQWNTAENTYLWKLHSVVVALNYIKPEQHILGYSRVRNIAQLIICKVIFS